MLVTSRNFKDSSFDSGTAAVPEGPFPQFNSATSSWSSRFGRLQFFEPYDIHALKIKKAHLLTLCGEQTHEIACAPVHHKTPAIVSYDELVASLRVHSDPRPYEVYNHTLCQRQDQLSGESVSAFTVTLRKLAADCNFGTSDTTTRLYHYSTMLPLDVMMQGRFV